MLTNRQAAVVLLLAPLLVGCDSANDPPEPVASTSRSSASTSVGPSETTATPTDPVEPTLPPEAEAGTEVGAQAFVRFYWDVVNYATKTGDVALLARLAEPSCEGCDAGAAGIRRVYDRGGRIIGGSYRVKRVELERSPSGYWTAVAHTWVGEQRTIGAGNLDKTFPAGKDSWLMGLRETRGEWRVSLLESA